MKLHPQMYTGNSLLQPETGTGGSATNTWDAAIFRPLFVHGNIRTEDRAEVLLDFAAIEREAREAQSAWISSILKSYFQTLVRKLRTQSGTRTAAKARNRAKRKVVRVSAD